MLLVIALQSSVDQTDPDYDGAARVTVQVNTFRFRPLQGSTYSHCNWVETWRQACDGGSPLYYIHQLALCTSSVVIVYGTVPSNSSKSGAD